ncbi:Arylsulfatase [Gimesia panareensis]|uniref:Arylsulfatase n=1 Tax=Gimesia panareensis TaxID=2527978 RepID=A0A518FLH5_9PLAN|nr:sulfatase [Gimesia panareensis]QDV17204.1 Arylsulfatase [Gimesia panareensis]
MDQSQNRREVGAGATRPNILVMIAHDLGCQIGPYGFSFQETPALSEFASQGMRLDRHFVSSPGCSQSRSSLVTGRYPHSNGQFGLANWGWKLNENEILLPSVLQQNGYFTTLFGIWHLHEWTLSSFCAVSDDVSTLDCSPEGEAEIASQRAARWLHNYPRNGLPFYLHVGFWEVHRPFAENGEASGDTDEDTLAQIEVPDYLPQDEATRREFVKLQQSIRNVDRGVARILNALNETGYAENTIVIFTADHGLPFQRAKGTLYDPGLNVSAIMRWPGHIPENRHSQCLTSNIDIMPTLLDAVGIPVPDAVQGVSRLELLQGGKSPVEHGTEIYAEKTYHEHYDPIRCVRTDRFKYIRNFAQRPMLVLPSDIYNSPSRQANQQDEALWAHRPVDELYDLDLDPLERTNLAERLEYRSHLTELRGKLSHWMDETEDPLRDGPILRETAEDQRLHTVSHIDKN